MFNNWKEDDLLAIKNTQLDVIHKMKQEDFN
jgi:hypothetical protein